EHEWRPLARGRSETRCEIASDRRCRGIWNCESVNHAWRKPDAIGNFDRATLTAFDIYCHGYLVKRCVGKCNRCPSLVCLRGETGLDDQWRRPFAAIESRRAWTRRGAR